MTSRVVATSLAFAIFGALASSAQTVDQLVANHVLLNAELERCKQLGMASVDDARCKIANAAENKRFFGTGKTSYTPHPVNVFPSAPVVNPQPTPQKGPPKPGSPGNG